MVILSVGQRVCCGLEARICGRIVGHGTDVAGTFYHVQPDERSIGPFATHARFIHPVITIYLKSITQVPA